MKTLGVKKMLLLLFLMAGWMAVYGQGNRLEVPGDHFSLEGALELFKKSASPEEFEKMLNSSGSKVNNLDLNGDGDIDYIKVIDRNEGTVHAFILQAVVSETEGQDIAVIELEKLANGKAVLQITGDADIYGIETIIEPTEEVRINAGTSTARTVVNVWTWPSVQYIYSPYYYSAWISPWGWSMRPMWWRPWRQVSYFEYNPWWEPYRAYYSICHSHRIVYAHEIYRPYRSTSIVVSNRHHEQITHYRSSRNNSGYTRGRDNDNGRQHNSTDRSDNRERQWSSNNRNENSRSSENRTNNWNEQQRQEQGRRKSSVTQDESFSRERTSPRNRSTNDVNRTPSVEQRNWGGEQRQESRKRTEVTTSNPVFRQRETRPERDNRSTQRSDVQVERRGSSGGTNTPTIERRGNGGGVNKSGGQRRGRE